MSSTCSMSLPRSNEAEVDRIDFEEPRLRWRQGRASLHIQKNRPRASTISLDRGRFAHRPSPEPDRRKEPNVHLDGTREAFELGTVNWLESGDECIYVTERDGWRHLYLIDAKTGAVKNAITGRRTSCAASTISIEDKAPGLVSRRRQEPGSGSVLHPLLPRQLRRQRPGRARPRETAATRSNTRPIAGS